MRKKFFLLLALSACSQSHLVAEPVIARVPVEVSCHAQAIMPPDWRRNHVAPDALALDKLKAVLADLQLSEGYMQELEAELKACS